MNNTNNENNKKQDKIEQFVDKLLKLNETKFPNDKKTKDNVLFKIMDHIFEKSGKTTILSQDANKFVNSAVKRYDSLDQNTKDGIKSVFAKVYAQYNVNSSQTKEAKSHPRINENPSGIIAR